MSAPLLTYGVRTTPDPMQVSPPTGQPSLATLDIIVSNDTHQPINCKSISFGFQQGTYAKDFFTDSTGIGTSAPTGWNLQQNGALFTATPQTAKDGQIGRTGLTFVISNIKVNQQAGTTDMTITEVTAPNTTGTQTYPLAKFPLKFEVGALSADPPEISSGDSTTLSWSGTSGATYVLQYLDKDDNTITISHVKGDPNTPLPATGTYTIDDVKRSTVFYLIVTLTVAGQDKPLKATRFFPVIVKPLPPNIEYFRPQGCTAPECVFYTNEFTLEWKIDNATNMQLTANDAKGTHVLDVPWKSTTKKIVQTESETEYVMTIKNEHDAQQQSSVKVTLIPPVLVGTIVAFAGPVTNLSAGWLLCNGQEVSGTTYPQLHTLLGNTYGTPNTSGNIVLPDLRGQFLRGVDMGAGVDPDVNGRGAQRSGANAGANVGSRQGQQLLNHVHNWDRNFALISDSGSDIAVQLSEGGRDPDRGRQATTNNDGGGNETRPVNVYVYFLIYGGIPQPPTQTRLHAEIELPSKAD